MNITLLYANKPFEEYEHFLPFALPQTQEKIQKLKSKHDKSLSLLSHLLARYEISSLLNLPFSDVKFKYNEYGKPYIEKPDFHFSVSHSGNGVAFVSHSSPIGIDIQKIISKNEYPALRFLTQNEQNFIKDTPVDFFKIWTMKEAYVKMLGTGLSTSFRSFDVLSDELTSMFFTQHIPPYYLSVCAENISNESINIRTVK